MSNIDDQLDAIIDAHLRFLEGDGPAPDLTTLTPDLRDEALVRVRLLEASWDSAVELPADDPVARRFGFDRAGEQITIDGRRVAQLRKAAGMDLNALHAMITAAGGDLTVGNLFNLEQNTTATVTQPVASAIVAALHTNLTELEVLADVPGTDPVRQFLAGPRFAQLIDDWAGRFGRTVDEVRNLVTPKVIAAQYRADGVTEDHLAAIVQTILDDLEP